MPVRPVRAVRSGPALSGMARVRRRGLTLVGGEGVTGRGARAPSYDAAGRSFPLVLEYMSMRREIHTAGKAFDEKDGVLRD